MGGKGSKQENAINPDDFQEMPREEIHEASDQQYMVVRNRVNGMLYDRYHLTFLTESDYQYYVESVKYRCNEENIVRAHYIVPRHKKQFCSTHYAADVYLEHCRARMSDYKDIPYPDNLYCMMAMLNGYQKLSDKVGGFPVSERQVLIDENGEVRVWINPDFSKNHPQEQQRQYNRGTHKSWDDEKFEMVDSIMRMIIQNSDDNDGPQLKFGDFYERQKINFNGRVGFQQAKQIIVEYSQYVNMKIPQVFESVLEIFRGDEEQYLEGDNNILPGTGFGEPYEDNMDENNRNQRLTNGSKEESNIMGRNSSHRNVGFVNSEYRQHQPPQQQQPNFDNTSQSFTPAIVSVNNISSNNNYQGSTISSPPPPPVYHHAPQSSFNPPTYHQNSVPINRHPQRIMSGPPVQNYRPLPSGNSVIKVPPPPVSQAYPSSARIQSNHQIQVPNYPQRPLAPPMYNNSHQTQNIPIIINNSNPFQTFSQPLPYNNIPHYNKIQQSDDLSLRQQHQIQNNVILKGSANIYQINQQKIMHDLNQYQKEETVRAGQRANYDENSKINIQNFNDSNQNQYYRGERRYENSQQQQIDGDQQILSQGDIQEQMQEQSRRRLQNGIRVIDNDVGDDYDNNNEQEEYEMERKRQQMEIMEQRQRQYQEQIQHQGRKEEERYRGEELNEGQNVQHRYEHQHQNAHINKQNMLYQPPQQQRDQMLLTSNGSKFSQESRQMLQYHWQKQQQQSQQRSQMRPNPNFFFRPTVPNNSNNNNNLAQQFAQQRLEIHLSGQKQRPLFSAPLHYSTSSNISYQQIRESIPTNRRQCYYTLNNEVQIDPQIAADLHMFTSGSLVA